MKQLIRSLVVVVAVIIGLAGCAHRTKPIADIRNVAMPGLTIEQVHDAIIRAGAARDWIMTDAGPGVINGRIVVRDHSADVRIPYSASGYSIEYLGSANMHAKSGQVHRNYYRWVNNLNKDIQHYLLLSQQPR